MRRAIITSLLVVLAGCGGNWSNKDIEFLKVLPNREQLAAKLDQATSTGQPLTGTSTRRDGLNIGDPSEAAASTKKAVTDFNKLLEFILAIPEGARQIPPTARTEDTRVWGPIADPNNPGLEVRLTIKQVDEQNFGWALEGRVNGGAYFPMILGAFKATVSLTEGQGFIDVPVAAFRDRMKTTPELQQLDRVQVGYFTDGDPRSVDMLFTFSAGALNGLSAVGYTSRQRGDDSGALAFQVRSLDPNLTAVNVLSRWNPNGAGRAEGAVVEGAYAGYSYVECWDSDFKVVYAAEGWPGGQTVGDVNDCPVVQDFPQP